MVEADNFHTFANLKEETVDVDERGKPDKFWIGPRVSVDFIDGWDESVEIMERVI